MKYLFIFVLRIYQIFISPLFPPSCRFFPSCSNYAICAFKRFGVFRGGYLSVKRILKCHPYHPGGYDPVPEKEFRFRRNNGS